MTESQKGEKQRRISQKSMHFLLENKSLFLNVPHRYFLHTISGQLGFHNSFLSSFHMEENVEYQLKITLINSVHIVTVE